MRVGGHNLRYTHTLAEVIADLRELRCFRHLAGLRFACLDYIDSNAFWCDDSVKRGGRLQGPTGPFGDGDWYCFGEVAWRLAQVYGFQCDLCGCIDYWRSADLLKQDLEWDINAVISCDWAHMTHSARYWAICGSCRHQWFKWCGRVGVEWSGRVEFFEPWVMEVTLKKPKWAIGPSRRLFPYQKIKTPDPVIGSLRRLEAQSS